MVLSMEKTQQMQAGWAVVTGASSGIGKEIAKQLAAQGLHLALVARSASALETTKKEILQSHPQIEIDYLPLDLSKTDSAKTLFQWTQDKGMNVLYLINNAGFGDYGPFIHADLKKQEEMIQLNCSSLMQLCHLYLPSLLKKQQAYLLNLASVASFQPGPFMSVYYASKAFVLSFTEALAEELRGSSVNITALCPGPTESKFLERASLQQSKLFSRLSVSSAKDVATCGLKALHKGQVIALPTFTSKFFVLVQRFAPRSLVRYIVKNMQAARTK